MTKQTDVQLEHGYWKIANTLSDALVRYKFTGREFALLLAIMRNTYGYNKTARTLSHSYLAAATGIGRSHVVQIIQKLKRAKVLSVKTVTLGLNKHFEDWKIERRREVPTGAGSPLEGTGGSPLEGTGGSPLEGTQVVPSTGPNKYNLKYNKKKTTRKKQKDIIANANEHDSNKNPETRVDILDVDRAFCTGYIQRTSGSLDIVVTESRRHVLWQELLSAYTLSTLLEALPGFFSTTDRWYSGTSGAVTLPFTPFLFKRWLTTRQHLARPVSAGESTDDRSSAQSRSISAAELEERRREFPTACIL